MSALGPMAGPPPDLLPLPPGAGPGGPGGPPGIGPGGPGGPPGGPGGDEEAEEQSHLHDAEDALHAAMIVESDPQDKAMIAKLLASIHQLLANRDKEKQDAMGMSPALKLAQRANRP